MPKRECFGVATKEIDLMHIYEVDDVDERLELLPMAARRALDCAGLKLTLSGWRAQSVEWRQKLTELGSNDAVDVPRVLECLSTLGELASRVSVEPVPIVHEPPAASVPIQVSRAFGEERPIPSAAWSALSALDRYVLAKVAIKARPDRIERAYREIVGQSAVSSHLEPSGGVRMVDVGAKPISERFARAETRVRLSQVALQRLLQGHGPKGDVLGVARVAAIQAAKKTADIIPLCHQLMLTRVSVDFSIDRDAGAVSVQVVVHARDRTGVEMEALTAASVAALTIYDMLKGVDRAMVIGPTQLVEKRGGRTGDFARLSVEAERA